MIKIPYLDTFIQYIHSWYPSACCSDKDCIPTACEKVWEAITQSQGLLIAQASQDALCHLCTSSAGIHMCAFVVVSY